MNRRSSYRSGVSRDAVQFFWIVVLLLVSLILWATGWAESLIRWAGDLLLDQVEKIGNTQPE